MGRHKKNGVLVRVYPTKESAVEAIKEFFLDSCDEWVKIELPNDIAITRELYYCVQKDNHFIITALLVVDDYPTVLAHAKLFTWDEEPLAVFYWSTDWDRFCLRYSPYKQRQINKVGYREILGSEPVCLFWKDDRRRGNE